MTITTRHPESRFGVPVVLGDDGEPLTGGSGVKAVLARLGWDHATAAAKLGVSVRTVRGWLYEDRQPETRCLNVVGMRRLSARLETETRVLFDREQFVELFERGDGFAQERGILFMMGIADPRIIEGDEAMLSLRLTDADGVVVEHALRVVLTTSTLPDLAELD